MSAGGEGAAAALLTAELDDPGSYGRVVVKRMGWCARWSRRAMPILINSPSARSTPGSTPSNATLLTRPLPGSTPTTPSREYYLTDVAAALRTRGLAVAGVRLDDPAEMQGVNARADLARAGRVLNEMVLED